MFYVEKKHLMIKLINALGGCTHKVWWRIVMVVIILLPRYRRKTYKTHIVVQEYK